jgi:antitoxin component of RelBE/YafQ-DinJ toxin-antitoxin module
MTTILIKPKTKAEYNLLTKLLKRMNIEIQLIEENNPNTETLKAIEDVKKREGIKEKNAQELFDTLGI